MSNYQPRRDNERVLKRNIEQKWVDIATREDCLFWFRQRIMQYGSNAEILKPQWFAKEIAAELEKAYKVYL